MGSLIVYIFKIRQLYVVKLLYFEYNYQDKKENIYESTVINRGNSNEEDIEVVLPSKYSYYIISSTLSNINLNKNIISIERLAKKSEIRFLISINECIDFKNIDINLSSSSTKGKVIGQYRDVPHNYGSIALITLSFISILPIEFFLFELYDEYKSYAIVEEYKNLDKMGWDKKSIKEYGKSELSKAYSKVELPITIKDLKLIDNELVLVISTNNKTVYDLNIISVDIESNGKKLKNIIHKNESYTNIYKITPSYCNNVFKYYFKSQNDIDSVIIKVFFSINHEYINANIFKEIDNIVTE